MTEREAIAELAHAIRLLGRDALTWRSLSKARRIAAEVQSEFPLPEGYLDQIEQEMRRKEQKAQKTSCPEQEV